MTDSVVVRACRMCGCTDERACPGGCWWVDIDLCSTCAVAPPAAGSVMRPDHEVVNDLVEYQHTGAEIGLVLSPFDAFCVCGLIQLALRHPGLDSGAAPREAGRRIVDSIAEGLASVVAGADVLIAKGYDAAQDR